MAWKEGIDPAALQARILRLESRVAELEQNYRAMRAPLAAPGAPHPLPLLLPSPAQTSAPPPGDHVSTLAAAPSARRTAPHAFEPAAPVVSEAAGPHTQPVADVPTSPRRLPPQPREQPPTPTTHMRERRPAKRRSAPAAEPDETTQPALEQRIGGRLFAIGGALVVIIGLALFMKLAVDQGWLGAMPPAVRCVFGAAFGLVLLLTGELSRRRINAWAATGLFATGIGAIYISIYAAYALFALLDPPTAFVLLALAALLGVAASVRANLAAVAVISLTGGYLAPILVRTANPSPVVLPLYLVVLLAGSLLLAAWKRGAFRFAAATGWLGTVLLGTAWVLLSGLSSPEIALAFLAITWGLMHMGHALALRSRALEESAYDDSRPIVRRPLSVQARTSVAASVSASSWAVGLGWWLLHVTRILPEELAPLAAIGPCLMLGYALAGGLRVLKDAPRTDSEAFGAVLLVQAGGLLIATIALAISGAAAVVVWLSLGVAAMVAGLWVGSRGLRAYGLVLLAIGTVRVVTYDLFFSGLATPIAVKWGVAVSWWMVLMVGAAAAWFAAAEITRRALAARSDNHSTRSLATDSISLPVSSALIGMVLATAAPFHQASDPVALMTIWMGMALVFSLGLSRLLPIGLAELSLLPAGASLIAWVAAFVAPSGIRLNPAMPALGLHSGTWAATALLAACGFITRRAEPAIRAAVTCIVAAGALYASTLEVVRLAELAVPTPHAALAAVSIWWGLVGIASVVFGFVWRNAPVRYAALGLMVITAGKVLVVDMADAPPLARVASLVVTGLLMLGVSVIYAKVARTLKAAEPRGAEQEGP